MNKTDRWLIENWTRAVQLETAMTSARQRHKELFVEVHRLVKRQHDLDCCDIHLTAPDVKSWGGQVGYSKTSWPHLPSYKTWRTGIYVGGISLDELSNEQSVPPNIYVWLGVDKEKVNDPTSRGGKLLERLRKRIDAKASTLVKKRDIEWKCHDDEDIRVCFFYSLPEECSQLRNLLLKDDGRGFVECIARHVSLMAGFSGILDEVLSKSA